MRILVYGMNDAAKAEVEQQRAAGNHTSLRSLEFFSPRELESCNLVISDDENVLSAYQKANTATQPLTRLTTNAEGKANEESDETEKGQIVQEEAQEEVAETQQKSVSRARRK